MIGPDDVRAAARLLDGVAHRTPVMRSHALGENVVVKPENLQRVGAFKFRGAYNKISSLPKGCEVVAYSSGNHAQAVALASRLLGAHATILMPEDAPQNKVAATRGYGADIVTYDRYTGDREAIAAELARGTQRRTIVPPYDDPLIMAGQGTAALELIEDAGLVDTLVVPVGGGGLHRRLRDDREGPRRATRRRRRAAGRRRLGAVVRTRRDRRRSTCRARSPTASRRTRPATLTWEVASRLVDEIVTVTDEQIVDAMRFAFERLKLVIEPSGAVGIAAYREGLVDAPSIGIVISGGNVDAQRFSDLIRSATSARS